MWFNKTVHCFIVICVAFFRIGYWYVRQKLLNWQTATKVINLHQIKTDIFIGPQWINVCNYFSEYENHISKHIQRSFTKRLPGFHKYSYQTRLKIIGLERLEIRRLHADLTMCYKIVHRLVNVPFDQFFKLTQHNSTRGHSLKLFYPDSRKSTRAHFFLCSCYLNMESPTCCSGPGKKFVCV